MTCFNIYKTNHSNFSYNALKIYGLDNQEFKSSRITSIKREKGILYSSVVSIRLIIQIEKLAFALRFIRALARIC